MLSLLKKPTSEVAVSASPAWHPDFRNYERLPDTKVVRTSFLINALVVLVTGVLLMAFCYQAVLLREVKGQVSHWEQEIARDSAPSARAIALYKKFQAESARVTEVSAFVVSRPIVSDLLLRLGETLPEYLAVDRFDLAETTLSLRAAVRGAPDQASGRASTYLQQLKSDAFFSERFADISLVNLNRNPQTGGLTLELSFKLKEAKKP